MVRAPSRGDDRQYQLRGQSRECSVHRARLAAAFGIKLAGKNPLVGGPSASGAGGWALGFTKVLGQTAEGCFPVSRLRDSGPWFLSDLP